MENKPTCAYIAQWFVVNHVILKTVGINGCRIFRYSIHNAIVATLAETYPKDDTALSFLAHLDTFALQYLEINFQPHDERMATQKCGSIINPSMLRAKRRLTCMKTYTSRARRISIVLAHMNIPSKCTENIYSQVDGGGNS